MPFGRRPGAQSAWRRWLRVWAAFETALLVVLLAVMIGVAAFQILARNLFGGGLLWGSDLVQVAMLWATMVGATAAVGGNRHISIDLVARFGGPRLQAAAGRLAALFSALICAALGWTSIEFVRWDFLDQVPGFASVPAWVCEAVIPVAAGAMAVRYLAQAMFPASPAAPRRQALSASERTAADDA